MTLQRRTLMAALLASPALRAQRHDTFPGVPADYLREAERVPAFWVSTVAEVEGFLQTRVKKGEVRRIGTSAGGRAIHAVFYGRAREGQGTATFSGSLGFGDVRAYLGPDHGKRVYLGLAGVHGGEFEGMMGMVNLLSILETGADLRGKQWPAVETAAARIDRLLVIPILNTDGRARIPLRMIAHRGEDYTVHEYLNTGGKKDGTLIGWPQCKEHIPLDFATVGFPGGYPNDAGVNVQHDDFLGAPQPETRALFDLCARERPDLTINMHTGANFMHPLRPFVEPALTPWFEDYYRRLLTRLTQEQLQASDDATVHANPARERQSVYNLDTALNLHCGTLSILIESPSHNFSRAKRNGAPFFHTPENLLDAQLLAHEEALRFLAETGGRARWTAKKA
jgi:hypothetical protein